MMLLLLWKRALLLAAAALIGLYSLFTATSTESLHSLPALDRLTTLGRLKPRVAILEPTSYHSEVFGALFSILSNIGIKPHLYREAGDWTELGQLLREPAPTYIEDVKPFLEANEYDVVIVNTCDDKFWPNHASVWTSLANSSARVLCTLHEAEWFAREAARTHLLPIRDRLTMLTLGKHAAHAVREGLRSWAREDMAWEGVEVHDYAPVFALPSSVRRHELPWKRVRHAGVLGRIAQGSRDYTGLLSDLEQSMMTEPEVWGYTLSDGFLSPTSEAFTLHLVGLKEGDIDFPAALIEAGALKIHEGVNTLEYYRLVGEMDIIVPSFAGDRYVTHRASASVPAAVMAQTPLLATAPIVEAYAYLDPSAYVLHPLGMRPVQALKHLRLGEDLWEAVFGEVPSKARSKAAKWWTRTTLARVQRDNERLFRTLLYQS